MSQQPATLFPAPPAAIEPDWLRDIRRRDANLTTTQARTAPHDRRALLKAYDEQARRLTELESQLQQARSFTFDLTEEVGALQTQLAAARQELAEQASKHGELRGQVTAMLEDFANGCVAVKMEPGKETTPYWMGVNTERHNNLKWAELKAKELGIEWPIKAIPYSGNLPSEPTPAAPLEAAVPAADSQLPFNPGFTPKCHGCGLPSHAARCRTADCPAKPTPAAQAEKAMCEVYAAQSDTNHTPEELRASAKAAAALPTTGEGKEQADV